MLAAYTSGEVPPGQREALEAHLATCPACRDEAGRMARAWHLLGAAEPIDASPQFATRVRDAVRETVARSAGLPRWWPLVPRLGWALALAVVVLAGASIGRGLATPPVRIADAGGSAAEAWLEAFRDMPQDTLSSAYLGSADIDGGGRR
jgi:anti-sigma factor RsiW